MEGDDRLWTSNASPLKRFLLKIITLISDEPPLSGHLPFAKVERSCDKSYLSNCETSKVRNEHSGIYCFLSGFN